MKHTEQNELLKAVLVMQFCSTHTHTPFVQKRYSPTVKCDELMWKIFVATDKRDSVLYT
jgi:hypothetical protein